MGHACTETQCVFGVCFFIFTFAFLFFPGILDTIEDELREHMISETL